jgi:hypothetical protein
MKTQFNFNRFGLLIQRYFTERFHTELIYWSIMIIAFLFFHNNIFAVGGIIFIAGLFYAARFFREIHSPANGSAYFMIPATQLEKLTVGILMTTFYYFGMMLIAYTIGNLLGTFLNNMLANIEFLSSYMELFHKSPLKWVLFETGTESDTLLSGEPISYTYSYAGLFFKIFLLIQSIYLLGSIYFKNNQAFKTFFATNIIQLLLLIVFIVELQLIVRTPNMFGNLKPEDFRHWKHIVENMITGLGYLLPVFFWVVSYFRLTEKEV